MKQRVGEQPFQPPPQGRRGLWGWTGFGKKTLWDWLQLLVVPAVLAIGGFLLAAAQENIQQQAEEQRAQDAALQAYLEGMGSLLLDEDLRGSEEDDEVRTLAEARTSTVLSRVDGPRKKSVVLFLYKSKLIQKDQPLVPLADADLSGAVLYQTDLSEANLSDANLSEANLNGVDLFGADLSDAKLGSAQLRGADLRDADLGGAYLADAGLFGADLSDADLSRAVLHSTDLSDADLSDADLSDADLIRTDLSDADLSDAGLIRADLIRTDLSDADLSGANLSDARGVTGELLSEAEQLEGATMPDGSIHD